MSSTNGTLTRAMADMEDEIRREKRIAAWHAYLTLRALPMSADAGEALLSVGLAMDAQPEPPAEGMEFIVNGQRFAIEDAEGHLHPGLTGKKISALEEPHEAKPELKAGATKKEEKEHKAKVAGIHRGELNQHTLEQHKQAAEPEEPPDERTNDFFAPHERQQTFFQEGMNQQTGKWVGDMPQAAAKPLYAPNKPDPTIKKVKPQYADDVPFSLDAYLSWDIFSRPAQGVLNRALAAAKKLSAQARKELTAAIALDDPAEVGAAVVVFVQKYRLQLATLLTNTQLAAVLQGAREVAKSLPEIPPPGTVPPPPPTLEPTQARDLLDELRALPDGERAVRIYGLPPDQQQYAQQSLQYLSGKPPEPPDEPPIEPGDIPDDAEVTFPVIDEAVAELKAKNVMTRPEFDQLEDAARAKAFTIASVDATETLTRIRDALAENVSRGADFETFKESVMDDVEKGTFLGDAHLENVFRTNVQSAFSDGQMKVIQQPFVRSGFPYIDYEAIHDDRVEETHLAMEKHGIAGTSIYRADDPVIRKFLPPWRWMCVPPDSLIVTEKGRRRIDSVNVGDKVLTHKGQFKEVLGTNTTKSVPEVIAVQLDSGAFCRATAEHPFFTQRGWVNASSLNISDEVYEIVDSTAPYLIVIVIDECAEFQRITDGGITLSIGPRGIPLNLYANSNGRKVKIKPKWKGLLVENEFDASCLKSGGKRLFVTSHSNNSVNVKTWISPNGFPPSGDHLRSNFGTARSAVDAIRSRDFLNSPWINSVVDSIGIPAATKCDSSGFEESFQSTVSNTSDFGNIDDASFLVDVIADDAIGTARPYGQTCLGVIQIGERTFWLFSHDYNCNQRKTKIKTINRISYGGSVCNLSVKDDESYICDGILLHNCRCSWIPLTVRQAAERGIMEAIRWLATGEEPTPPAFVEMPPFEPPPGFRRSLADAPLSLRLSLCDAAEFDAQFAEDGKWITIGGHVDSEKGEKHAGGFHVKIDGEGRILAGGPSALRGKNVSEIHKAFKKPVADVGKKRDDKDRPPAVADLAEPEKKKNVPEEMHKINSRIDKYSKLFRDKEPRVADWLDKLKAHVNEVGSEAALEALGEEKVGGDDSETQYQGGWESMGEFAEKYLDRQGISLYDFNPQDKKIVSSMSPSQGEFKRDKQGDFFPADPKLKDKLAEAKALPGLEKSEDINTIMGRKVESLTPDVIAKLDETYGPGKWIVKTYGEDAFAGRGIFFPQRAAQIKQDAQNAIWEAGSGLARYGFSLRRDDKGKVVGLEHTGGDRYDFGTDQYNKVINGHARELGDRAASAAGSEQGAELPFAGKDFMAQPAFPVVGISDADRAKGMTIKPGQEGRVHVVTRNGKAEVIPHSTWLKEDHLPVVFESEDTKAMAKAAQEAIDALPESERQGQIYAPDIVKTADGYKVVEANPANETGASGYLGDNPFIIDSYVSHLTGRTPAHVRFIQKLLRKR